MISQYYCALKLEVCYRALAHILDVDDAWCTAEWGKETGMYHLHCLLWLKDSVAFDCTNNDEPDPKEVPLQDKVDEDDGLASARDHVPADTPWAGMAAPTKAMVSYAANYYEKLVCEWHPQKPACEFKDASADTTDPDVVKEFFRVGERRAMIDKGTRRKHLPCATSATSHSELLKLCERRPNENDRALYDRRAEWLGRLVDSCQLHDYHDPRAGGLPAPHQTCCKIEKGTEQTRRPKTYCSRALPRVRPVQRGEEIVEQDPYRRSLLRLWTQRNCAYVCPYIPILSFLTQTNNDASPILCKGGLVDYVCKYVTALKSTAGGSGAGTAIKAAENLWDEAMRYCKAEEKGVTSAVIKFYNAKAAPSFITAPEVCGRLMRLKNTHRTRPFYGISASSTLVPVERESTETVVGATKVERYELRRAKVHAAESEREGVCGTVSDKAEGW